MSIATVIAKFLRDLFGKPGKLASAESLWHRKYVVKKGDTLSAIAARELGGAERWPEIQRLNELEDPNVIKPDQVLKLPLY